MFCTSCGSTLADGAKFCGSCGKAVEIAGGVSEAKPDPLPAGSGPWAPSASLQESQEFRERAVAPEGRASGPSVPRPWLRYWAKLVDVWLWVVIMGVVFGIAFPRWSMETNETLLGLILLACTIPIHALLLSTFGNTIGKALLGIRVTHKGQKLSFGQALKREGLAYVKGLGLGIPIVALFTQINSYNHLKNEGASSWDKDEGHVVTHRDPSIPGIVGAVAILFCLFLLIVYGSTAGQGY